MHHDDPGKSLIFVSKTVCFPVASSLFSQEPHLQAAQLRPYSAATSAVSALGAAGAPLDQLQATFDEVLLRSILATDLGEVSYAAPYSWRVHTGESDLEMDDSLVSGLVAWWFLHIFTYLGNHRNWRTHIFQRGWNHHPDWGTVCNSMACYGSLGLSW